ncbi:alpha/beta hydrolase [Pararoseomonas sp. SCSIO 73927]|uniref:alpha/beta fold hydrolase n=1 Tax=Pararoseomonas sp. SCSIO 73927 TaxID=3114537 RepID=UPI0030D38625
MSSGEGLIEGFERRRLPGHGVEIDALVGGSGPPVLLLHGYPQTRMIWKRVAPALARRFTVVAPDLRGYGRSDKPEGDEAHDTYSKRTMALDQIETMRALGHDRFSVAGHDRGGRVAYRLALDHPAAVERIAVLDILPTAEMWAKANARSAMGAYHWYMLAQPRPLPERLVGADPEFYLRWTLRSWAAEGFAFDPECLEDYIRCGSAPAAVHAACEDYRAGWTRDQEADEADRGRRRIGAPLLVLWGRDYSVAKADPVKVWSEWAGEVRGQPVPGGHFQPDEAPEETARALLAFLSG